LARWRPFSARVERVGWGESGLWRLSMRAEVEEVGGRVGTEKQKGWAEVVELFSRKRNSAMLGEEEGRREEVDVPGNSGRDSASGASMTFSFFAARGTTPISPSCSSSMSADPTSSHGSRLILFFAFPVPSTVDPAPGVFGTFAHNSLIVDPSTEPLALLDVLRACFESDPLRSWSLVDPMFLCRWRTREGLRWIVWV
jgi:hypothetical protein